MRDFGLLPDPCNRPETIQFGLVIMAMPSNKAPGYDRIPVFVIKDCLPFILPALTVLINSSFSNSVFPKAWKKSEVVPHLKDGDHEISLQQSSYFTTACTF